MSSLLAKRLVVFAASLLLCSCVVNSLKPSQPATTLRVRVDGGAFADHAMRVSGNGTMFLPDADGVFTLDLPEVERRCIRELRVFGLTFGRDPVPVVEVLRKDSSHVRRRVPITTLDELPADADGVRLLK